MLEKKKGAGNCWWCKEWTKILESFGWTVELARGKVYVRNGKVYEFKVSPGRMQANVQEKEHNNYHVVIQVDVLTSSQWNDMLNFLADRALFMAKLLTGEMPDNINDVVGQIGISLFPQSPQNFHAHCSCNVEGDICRHVAALLHFFTVKLAEDPFLLFRIRGMNREEIIEGTRMRRTIRADNCQEDREEVYGDSKLMEQTDNYTLENYWRGDMDKSDFNITISPSSTEDFVFNKLGEPSFFGGKRDMVRQLKRDYRRILSKALTAGYSEEEE